MQQFIVLATAAIIVLGRFAIEPRLTYEALTYPYIGGLFGSWLARRGHISERVYAHGLRALLLLLAIGLSVFELAMFLYKKFGG